MFSGSTADSDVIELWTGSMHVCWKLIYMNPCSKAFMDLTLVKVDAYAGW